jgi:regulator of protease activity HflC (stomatin/prohibitin superfamily)
VDQKESGVMLRFGSIVDIDGQEALEPGWRRNLLPHPMGEFIIFNVDGRTLDLGDAYWPRIPANVTLDRAIDGASVGTVLKPGEVGSVLTMDGDLAHLRLGATYKITDPVAFVEVLHVETGDERDADHVVRMSLERAVVQAAATTKLTDLVDHPEGVASRIREASQQVLDSLGCGIQLTEVRLYDVMPPLAIYRAYREVQNAREEALKAIESARKERDTTLINAAGADWRAMAQLVGRYQEADDRGDQREAQEILSQVNQFLDSDQVGGDLAGMINHAKAYESEIELNLGQVTRKFTQLLPAYRERPDLECRRLWVEAVKSVVSRRDVEIYRVPPGLTSIRLSIARPEEVMKVLREESLRRKQEEAQQKAAGAAGKYYQRTEDWNVGEANPLMRNRGGTIKPVGTDR